MAKPSYSPMQMFMIIATLSVCAICATEAAKLQMGSRAELLRPSADAGMGSRSTSQQSYTADADNDRVFSLPGWGTLKDFNMFSGYVTVDRAADRNLFYIYTESSTEPDTQPLLLWLNGGPGCSSIGGGFLSELGPFLPRQGGKTLQANPHSWNKIANVLFVESPAFVGFSYSGNQADRVVGDARTAADMRVFLLKFIKRFPHLADRELYISGESYAGHYLPTLAWEIVKGNKEAEASGEGRLNFKGILLGNPWTDAVIDNAGAVDFWWAHALISDTAAQGIKANCDFSQIGPLDAHPTNTDPNTREGACDKYCNLAAQEIGTINIYQIYADVCPATSAKAEIRALAAAIRGPQAAAGLTGTRNTVSSGGSSLPLLSVAAADMQAWGGSSDGSSSEYDPCVDDEVFTYLNLPEVQKALHANVTGQLPGPWADCNMQIAYSRDDLFTSMLPVWKELIETEGLRFLIYSGDIDGIVPVVGTRRWVAGLGLPEAAHWRPWYPTTTQQHQVGGYVEEYFLPWQPQPSASQASQQATDENKAFLGAAHHPVAAVQGGFTFATVRAAGHMVPYTQRERALHLAARFLAGRRL